MPDHIRERDGLTFMNGTNTFFTLQTVQAALEALLNQLAPLTQVETIPVSQANGRIVAKALQSPVDLPNFTRSTMDGYAVLASDTFGASDTLPAYLHYAGAVAMGEQPTMKLTSGQAVEIHTGAMLPGGADAVVMIEHTQAIQNGNGKPDEIEILKPVAPGENVLQIGEDITAGAQVLPAGRRIRPQDMGGLLAIGIMQVDVVAAPRVGLISCGDELIPPDAMPNIGQIRDINAYILGAMVTEQGAASRHFGIARDRFDHFFTKARDALKQSDMVVISAGSSVSVRDLTQSVINKLGEPGIIQHGLAVKPGKPTILAVCDGKPVIGLPGNPVSAMLVARQIVRPVLAHLMGEVARPQGTVRAILAKNIASVTGRDDSVPVRLIPGEDGTLHADPIFGKSNLIYTLVNADGLVHVPLNQGGYIAGTEVDVLPI